MNVLVTGGAGFIGSHVVEWLIADGHSVTVIDNFSTGKRENLPTHSRLTLIEKDVLDCSAATIASSASSHYDGLIHLAAIPSVSHSWSAPQLAHNNTLSTTVAVIQLCQQLGISRIVFASSAAVYGHPAAVPVSEDCPTRPLSPYGLQKLASENYISLYASHLGISAVSLRFFNVFGPRQDARSPYSGVISVFAQAMRSGSPVVINGSGEQTRDFVYVKDVVTALKKALLLPLMPGQSVSCNIGTGQSISILQLRDALQDCFPRWQANTRFAPARAGDIHHSQADISKAQQYLAFEPTFSVQRGLSALIASLPQGVPLSL